MPLLDLEVEGRIAGIDIKEAVDKDGNKVDVSGLSSHELAIKINRNELNVPSNLIFAGGVVYGSVAAYSPRGKNGD